MEGFRNWLSEHSSGDSEIAARETSDGVELTYQNSEAKGSIYAQKDAENPNIYRVIRVWAKPEGKGHGKKLYLAAMEAVTRKGGLLAPAKNSTSDSAANVWRSLYSSKEVERTPLGAKDWPMSGRNNSLVGKYPDLRYSDPSTYPPKADSEFWTFNSGYRLKRTAPNVSPPKIQSPQIQRRSFPPGTEDLTIEDM